MAQNGQKFSKNWTGQPRTMEKTHHIAVGAKDALIAALKVKTEHPEAVITYVRQQNRRGDARHPSHTLGETLVDE
jgi:hypothetical protein